MPSSAGQKKIPAQLAQLRPLLARQPLPPSTSACCTHIRSVSVEIPRSTSLFNDTATTVIYTLSLHDALPIYRAPCLFHTGTSGIGAGMPGGQGVELAYARPIHLDGVAARYPEVPVIMAHFGWPWHLEAIAIALHKTNVYLELSGWAPRYVPDEVI